MNFIIFIIVKFLYKDENRIIEGLPFHFGVF